jgi:Tfp pilus assembly protein PilV
MEKTLKNKSGASIVEIILTLLIISITTLIIMSFSHNTIMMNQDARVKDTACLAAEQKIADLAAINFASLPQSGNDAVVIDKIPLTRNWTVQQSGFIIMAKVTVSWKSLKGTTREFTLAGAVD